MCPVTERTLFLLPHLIRCTHRAPRQQWDLLSQCKNRILELMWSPTVNSGMKLSAVKFIQKVVLVQTRGVSDPRVCVAFVVVMLALTHTTYWSPPPQLQNKNDPNIASVSADHPFISASPLEAEGMKLLESVITMLYTSQ